jgi:hypothetical protein
MVKGPTRGDQGLPQFHRVIAKLHSPGGRHAFVAVPAKTAKRSTARGGTEFPASHGTKRQNATWLAAIRVVRVIPGTAWLLS